MSTPADKQRLLAEMDTLMRTLRPGDTLIADRIARLEKDPQKAAALARAREWLAAEREWASWFSSQPSGLSSRSAEAA